MSLFRLILLSVRHFWKMNVAVACGVAVGTAVLTGALLVGDSMQGSLRDLVLAGLGRIDEVLVADHFFREQLAGDKSSGNSAAPVILYSASVETVDPAPPARVDQVNLIGCDERFWQLGNGGPPAPPQRDEIVLNEPVARLLAVKEGDSVMLGLPKTGGIPAESAFGRKRVSVDTMRLKVARVIPAEGLGRFGLRPNQRVPRNAYISLAALQTQLQEPGRVNAILRPTPPPGSPWHPQLADYGIHVEPSPRGYIDVTTERMIFPPAVEQALLKQLGGLDVQPALTYLANTHRLRQTGGALLDHHGDRFPGPAAAGPLPFHRRFAPAQAGRRPNRLEHLGGPAAEGPPGRLDPRHVLRARKHASGCFKSGRSIFNWRRS